MTKAIYCSVETCDRDTYVRRLCRAHYDRLQKFGDVRADIPLRKLPRRDERDDIERRILSQCVTDPETSCITWTGYTMPECGYGTISWNARQWVVHRAIWTVQVGPIPTDDDWTLDHLCFNRACVNIKHLEVVTRIENSRRGGGLLRAQVANRRRSNEACKNGHPRTDENTAINKHGHRYCRDCKRATWARHADSINAKRNAKHSARRAETTKTDAA